MSDAPLHVFVSHISGKNATVSIYSDRIEWLQPRGVSGGKLMAGIMTAGLSTLATGLKGGKTGTEFIPIKSISSVTTKRDGLLNTLVQVITSGNTIDFRVSHSEAAQVRQVLQSLILGSPPAQAAPTAPPVTEASASAPVDVVEQIKKLSELRDSGILTDDEFIAKKADLLSRM
jgi:hypothetical protein